ncbi:hypothetical protein OF83DRAFT_1128576 [Amylostereum chailletii]|nr:hypothetical protein OF83DRAFT_1128576 [Amylostereum chailletii]
MGKIRKKTSKRGTTNRRSQIQHKVAESRKKAKRAAKKNPQWKTKTPKDPGIPNNFPYKEQILAEIAEERRKAAEEKERRKEEKKALKLQAAARAEGGEEEVGEEEEEAGSGGQGSSQGFDGVVTLNSGTRISAKKAKNGPVTATEPEEDSEEVPLLLNPDLPNLKSVLERADVVVQVLDARDPLPYRSSQVEGLAKAKEGRKLLFVLNKIDTCPREVIAAWASHLRSSYPTLPFRSASAFLPVIADAQKKTKGKESATDAWGVDAISTLFGRWAQEKSGLGPLTVAVVGLANAGKSAFINSMLKKHTLPVYSPSAANQGPSTTPYAVSVELECDGQNVVLIDTPGLALSSDASYATRTEDSEKLRASDILLRNRGKIAKLKDPAFAVEHIVSRAETEDLMLFYSLPAFAKGDANAFLSGVARATGFVKKGGVLDLTSASRLVLRDWSIGKLPRFSIAPSSGSTPAQLTEQSLAELYAKDEAVLARLSTRKEMRKANGIVRLASGSVETRVVDLDAPWEEEDNESDNEDSEDGDGDVEIRASVAEDDEEDDEEEDEEGSADEVPVPIPSKRKHTREPAPRPTKRVAFAAPKSKSQSKPRPAPSPSTGNAPPSALKKQPKAAIKKTPARPVKVANAPAPGKAKKPDASGDEYNFGAFFR